MSLAASKPVRAIIGVAMLIGGAPAIWDAWEAVWPSIPRGDSFPALYFAFWGTAWAVLAVWAWRGARAAQGRRRTAGAFVTAVLVLATLGSFAFMTWLWLALMPFGGPWTIDVLGLLSPGFLVGGVWLLSGLRRGGGASPVHDGA